MRYTCEIEAHGVQTQTSIPMNPSLQRVVWAVRRISMLTVSSDLVDDLLVQLILKLHPLDRDNYRQLDQQKLLALTLQVGSGNTTALVA